MLNRDSAHKPVSAAAAATPEGEADAEEDRDGEIDDEAPLVDFVRQRQLERWRDLDKLNAESNYYSLLAKSTRVGHYRFSVDAAERAEQLAALNRRTEQKTELAKRRRVEALEKRRDAAAARLERQSDNARHRCAGAFDDVIVN
uniref:Uncharacterized protein n=1 Tax=Macrostomum lignano TaxID=282301 RepID=A0A1I8F9N1_9PLAT